MAFQASTAITLTTDVCIDKYMEIDFLWGQRLPESTPLTTKA